MIVIGVIFLILGIVMLFRPCIEWLIKFNNSLRGVQTEITKTTIIFYRIIAVIWILFSFAVIFGYL